MAGLASSAVFILIFTALLIGTQMAEAQTTTTTAGPELCPELSNFNETVLLSPADFDTAVAGCMASSRGHREALTTEALVLVELYENLKNHSLMELHSLLDPKYNATLEEIRVCVKTHAGKELVTEEARKHFGFNGTQALKFEYDNCLKSMNVRDCIEDVFFENVKDKEMKRIKDAFMSSLGILSEYCEVPLRDVEKGAGHYHLPTLSLIVGTALMLTKLVIFN